MSRRRFPELSTALFAEEKSWRARRGTSRMGISSATQAKLSLSSESASSSPVSTPDCDRAGDPAPISFDSSDRGVD